MVELILLKTFNDNKKINLDRLYDIIEKKITCSNKKIIVRIPYHYSYTFRQKIKRIEKGFMGY